MQSFHTASALTLASFLGGCLFDNPRLPPARKQDHQLDTILSADAPFDREAVLFQPVHDPALGPQAASEPEALPAVNVKEGLSGEVVRYRITRRRFGDWNPLREFQRNYFHLRTLFLLHREMPETTGLGFDVRRLYEEAARMDRFTRYYDSSQAESARQRLFTTVSSAFGIRIDLSDGGDTVIVIDVVPESPAGRAGLPRGARILGVNDSSVVGDSAAERFHRFTEGGDGTRAAFAYLHEGRRGEVSLVKEPVNFPSILVDSVGGAGYIAVFSFSSLSVDGASTHDEFVEALAATRHFPVTLLDLRDNGGGALNVAMSMCEEVLAGGVVIRQTYRHFHPTRGIPLTSLGEYEARPGNSGEGRSFVLLANGGSASASEIFLVALKEGLNAPLVGQKTYGKGIGQSVLATPAGGLSVITSLKFTSRNGVDYHGVGLTPDHVGTENRGETLALALEVAEARAGVPLAKRRTDPAVGGRLQALEWNRRQRVRPGVRGLMSE